MKNLALYLPQYHTIPENDKWWGKDFTEWTTVKNGKKFFKAHQQPKVPLNDNYYDLVTMDSVYIIIGLTASCFLKSQWKSY